MPRLYLDCLGSFSLAITILASASCADSGGRLRHTFAQPREPIAVSADDIRRYQEARLQELGDPAGRPRQQRLNAVLPFPERMPAYASLQVDGEGRVTGEVGEYAHVSLGHNGMGIAFGGTAQFTVADSLIWYGQSSRFELLALDRTGEVRRIVRLARAPSSITSADIDASLAAVREDLERQGAHPNLIGRILETEFAATYPLHGPLLAARSGELWVERFRNHILPDDRPREWDIFDPEGRLRGSITLPAGFQVAEAGAGYLLGVHVDSVGVQRVRLYRINRAGNGPGEFQAIGSAVECGGKIVALDWAGARLTHFTEDGAVLRTTPFAPYRDAGVSVVLLTGCVRGAPVAWATAVTAPHPGPPALEVTRSPRAVVRLDPASAAIDTLLTLPGSENLAGLSPPFGRWTLFTLTESAIYATTNDDDEIRAYSPGGALELISRRVRPPVTVTAADVARIREQYLGGLPPALAQEIEPRFDAAPIPKTMPFFSQLLEDGTGHLWARVYYPFREGEDPRWSVFAPDGAWLGEVDFPAGLRVHEVGPEYILGVWKDELDVEYLRVYPIIR